MEIKSPAPEPKTVEVTDIDITTVGGAQLEVTLWPGDSENENEHVMVFEYVANPLIARRAEHVVVFRRHVAWISRRTRIVPLPPSDQAPVDLMGALKQALPKDGSRN